MKTIPLRYILLLFASVLLTRVHAQNLSGQWTGGFITTGNTWGGKTEYVMDLNVNGSKVDGYSYTYFIISGKRHYVICKLKGNFDKGSKSIVVSEVEKVKSNTPPDFKDLFQTHTLTFLKQGAREVLEGKWKPASINEPPQGGQTTLERKALVRVTPTTPTPSIAQQKQKPASPSAASKPATTKPAPSPTEKRYVGTQAPDLTEKGPQTATPLKTQTPSATGSAKTPQDVAVQKADNPLKPANNFKPMNQPESTTASANNKIDQRSKKLIQLIEVDEPNFTVELYDNGQVDGDTVSLFFNDRLMVSRKRLSTTPISIELNIDPNKEDNELVMFAENMGSIPPNTALMIVTVRDKRYEVNITSTEQSNGAVRFKLKKP